MLYAYPIDGEFLCPLITCPVTIFCGLPAHGLCKTYL